MTTFGPPPTDTSILAYAPFFPNGQVNDAWNTWFTSLYNTVITGPVLSFNGRTGLVVPASGDYSASQITGLAAFIAANGVSSFNGRSGAVVPASGDYTAPMIPFTQAGTGAISRTSQDKLRDQVNVKDFGAVGDGTTDDTAAIQKALDYGASTGFTVYAAGPYKITSALNIKCGVDFTDAQFYVYSTPAYAINVGDTSGTTRLNGYYIKLPGLLQNMTKPGTGWAGQGVGVRVFNAYACTIKTGHIQNFATGLLVSSGGSFGSVYNTFMLGHLDNNQINLDLAPSDTVGWVNENVFIGGRLGFLSAEGTSVAGTRQIRIKKSTQVVNGNTFIKPSIEGDVPEYHVENGGASNTIQGARWEAATPKVLYTQDNTNQATLNTITGGYGVDNIVFTFSGISGYNNSKYGARTWFFNGTGSGGEFRAQNTGSSAYPIWVFYEAGTYPETAGSNDWSVSFSSQFLYGKQKADANPRLWLDFVNGKTYFANGTETPSRWIGALGTVIAVSGTFCPSTDAANDLGISSLRFRNIWTSGYTSQAVGGSVASASTITPTGPVFPVSGSTTINTINLPYTGFTGTITLIPTGKWSTGTSGNIAKAMTANIGQEIRATFDGTKWQLSFLSAAFGSVAAAAPTGTTSTTSVMMGIGLTVTPTRSGVLVISGSGQMANSTLNDGATVQLYYGTGTPPVNGAAVTGTAIGTSQTHTSLVAADTGGWSFTVPVPNLTQGTTYWIDVALKAVTGGTATVTGVTIAAVEM